GSATTKSARSNPSFLFGSCSAYQCCSERSLSLPVGPGNCTSVNMYAAAHNNGDPSASLSNPVQGRPNNLLCVDQGGAPLKVVRLENRDLLSSVWYTGTRMMIGFDVPYDAFEIPQHALPGASFTRVFDDGDDILISRISTASRGFSWERPKYSHLAHATRPTKYPLDIHPPRHYLHSWHTIMHDMTYVTMRPESKIHHWQRRSSQHLPIKCSSGTPRWGRDVGKEAKVHWTLEHCTAHAKNNDNLTEYWQRTAGGRYTGG
ncbi:hypothetical protein BDZ97DRAFT_2025812, partial [Flammula alnicola]